MLGCGETAEEVRDALLELRTRGGVDVVTLGQYMRPTKRHMAVSEFVTPAAFDAFATSRGRSGLFMLLRARW